MICMNCGNRTKFSGYWTTTLQCTGDMYVDKKTGEVLYPDDDFNVCDENLHDFHLDSCAECGSSNISETDDLFEAVASVEGVVR